MLVVKTTSPETCPSPANVQPEKDTPSSSTTNARLRPASGPTLRPCSKLCSQPIVHQLSTNYRAHDPRGQLPPEVGAVRGPTPECVLVHRPLIRQVNQREICRCSGRDTICPSPAHPRAPAPPPPPPPPPAPPPPPPAPPPDLHPLPPLHDPTGHSPVPYVH